MAKTVTADVFDIQKLTFQGLERDVFVSRTGGRPVIVMHELLGMTPTVVEFAKILVNEGFKVYAPVFFGSSDPDGSNRASWGCLVNEFKVLTSKGPGIWAQWIRGLAAQAYADCEAVPGKGVGVIGLCLTGNLALSATLSPVVTAPVMSEPSLPFAHGSELHVSEKELSTAKTRIRDEGLEIRGYRYQKDILCPAARFKRLENEFGKGFVGTTIPSKSIKLHSVFTEHLRDKDGNLRHGEIGPLVTFLRARV